MLLNIDLRKRVLAAVDSKVATIATIAKTFSIGRRTIHYWIKLRQRTNGLTPNTHYQRGHSHTITDWDEFAQFVQKHAHLTSPAMCIEWEKVYNRRITQSVMKRGLKKLGYTFKKNSFAMRNRTNSSEQIFYVKSTQ